MRINNRPMVLVILDGWGHSENTDHNAIHRARKPNWERLWNQFPHTLVSASGTEVGLPGEQMGNSEVGHLNLGAGRVVYQEFTRISQAIASGTFFTNRTLTDAVDTAIATQRSVHILGLLSPGGVHSHEEHIQAMVEMAVKRGAPRVYVHAFLDGRDTPPKSARASIEAMENVFRQSGGGRFASLIGRYYAMDRDHRWPRIKAAFDLVAHGKAQYQAPDALTGLRMAYERGETDEFVSATVIVPAGEKPAHVADGDVMVFMNYRSDRARQMTRAFIEPEFDGFDRGHWPRLGQFVSLTEYNKDFAIPVAYPPVRLNNTFGEYVAKRGLRQLRIAETEKYAHVTFFFNGGEERPFEGEDRILIPSPNVATYDQKPEMSAFELTDALEAAIRSGKYDTIVCNYANPDMVGHTGSFAATVTAIEAVDRCLGRIARALEETGGEMLITADHGNAEQLISTDHSQPHTAHTCNLVPLIYMGRPAEIISNRGILADVAPTLLHLMGLDQPPEMTGQVLVRLSTPQVA